MPLSKTIIITMGDPSGIGAEIIVRSLSVPGLVKGVRFIVVGDKFVFQKIQGFSHISNSPKIEFIDLNNVNRRNFCFGKISSKYGAAAMEYVDVALDLVRQQQIKALVSAPVGKESIAKSMNDFRGQTEYLAAKCGISNFGMLLINDSLKLALVTRHLPLKDVADKITVNNIVQVARLTASFLKSYYLIKRPKIAICSLNPHASDGGLIGDEEKKKIIPAIKKLKFLIDCSGPYPADLILSRSQSKIADAIVVMYHDQALIPLKIDSKFNGVNITMGLPFIRTSPLHGTAYAIAGKNKANYLSMRYAINTAIKLAKNVS